MVETAPQLEEGGELVVLAAGRVEAGVLVPKALVLGLQGVVVDAQAVDLGHRLDRVGDRAGDAVDGRLDRPEGEADAALELPDRRARRDGHEKQGRRPAGSGP